MVQQERLWSKQRYCSISCSKIHSNCMNLPGVREKVSAALKALGHAVKHRGGNGQLTEPQMKLLERLGEGWVAEFAVPVPGHEAYGFPRHLKIDLAQPRRMIAVEVVGRSHQSPERRLQDSRKTTYLAQNGWFVFRVTNQRALELSSTCTSLDTLLTSLMAFSPTTAI